jgi:hypothetical protein
MKKALWLPALVAVFSGLLLTGCYNGVTYYPQPSYTNPLPSNVPQSQNITTSTFSVPGNSYTDMRFTLSTLMKTPRASGSFTAKGNVEAYILDDAGFTAFSSGAAPAALSIYYYSGSVASANIDVAIDGFSGRYHLIFKNSSAQVVSVTANVNLGWQAINSIGQP